jgi:hypothetical protein
MKVYNPQVEGLHSYAVGHPGILVHNSSGSPTPGYSPLPAKGNPIGSGAEGTVYELPGHPDWVLKEFKPGTAATQASNEASNLDALRRVFGDRHVVQTVTPPRRFARGQPVVLLKQKVTIVVAGEDQPALQVIVDTLKQNNITADVGKNLVWGHTGDGIPRWIWIE